jgi:hypothetical protein
VQARAARFSAAAADKSPDANTQGADCTGIQIIICASKYDQIRSQPLPLKQAVAKALRCVAHCNGAHLVYFMRQGLSRGQKDGEAEDMAGKMRAIMAHAMFIGFDRKLCGTLLPCDLVLWFVLRAYFFQLVIKASFFSA